MRRVGLLRIYLWVTAAAVFGCVVVLGVSAWNQYMALGVVSILLLAGMAAGALVCGLTPVAIRSLERFARVSDASGNRPFWAQPVYYRLVVIFKFTLFLCAVFGPRKELLYSFALHMLGAVLCHRIALCFPGMIQQFVLFMRRHRALRVADLLLTNIVITVILVELVLRGDSGLRDDMPWLHKDPFQFKLREDIFGFAPNSLGYNDSEFNEEKTPGRLRIAAIGDSFFVAHVPHAVRQH